MSLPQELKRTLDALAQAQAAAYLSQQDKRALPGITPAVEPLVSQQPPQVALLVGATLPDHLLEYALDTCHHLKAALILLDSEPHRTDRLASQLRQIKAANIPINVLPLPAAKLPELHDFALNQPRLLFVIVSAKDNQNVASNKMQWHSPAPLVVVSEQRYEQGPAAFRPHP